mmetsp:Transcript_15727/g.44780  ORF Transcript_15727/g.44780 Transcript_15727/m.44780 type:complete len:199 (-) Transcript_15727:540-1136(-)
MPATLLATLARASSSICAVLCLPEDLMHRYIRALKAEAVLKEEARKAKDDERAAWHEWYAGREPPKSPVKTIARPEPGSVFLPAGIPEEDLELLQRQAKRLRSSLARRRRSGASSSGGEDRILSHYEQLLTGVEERIRLCQKLGDVDCIEADALDTTTTTAPSSWGTPSLGGFGFSDSALSELARSPSRSSSTASDAA